MTQRVNVQLWPEPLSPTTTWNEHALSGWGEARLVSDRLVRFPGASWQEIEALPQPLRWTVQRTIFHLAKRASPDTRGPFPK